MNASEENEKYNNSYKNIDIIKPIEEKLHSTDTNMYVDMLADSTKLISESQRWKYNNEINDYISDDNKMDCKIDEKIDDKIESRINNKPLENKISGHGTYDNDNIYFEKKNRSENYRNKTDSVENKIYSDAKKYEKKQTSEKIPQRKELYQKDKDLNITEEELNLKKLDILCELAELANNGVKLSQNYSMSSDYNAMRYEYELRKGIGKKQSSISWWSTFMLTIINGLEMLNNNYDPFGIKLSGWSEQMSTDIINYRQVFGELYDKYNKPGSSISPEVRLLFMIAGSAFNFHLMHSLVKSMPSMNDELSKNPELLKKLRENAIANTEKHKSQKIIDEINKMNEHEHLEATNKLAHIQMLKNKELEHIKLTREKAEYEALKNKLEHYSEMAQNISQKNKTIDCTDNNSNDIFIKNTTRYNDIIYSEKNKMQSRNNIQTKNFDTSTHNSMNGIANATNYISKEKKHETNIKYNPKLNKIIDDAISKQSQLNNDSSNSSEKQYSDQTSSINSDSLASIKKKKKKGITITID